MTKKLIISVILLLVSIPAFAQSVDTAWVRRYNGPGNDIDVAKGIAVDTSGNVYVTGKSIGSGTSEDYATIKYDASGNQPWAKRYNGPGNGWDEATAIAVDISGNVYVTGRSTGSGADEDYATIKYYTNGDTAWVRRYDGASANLGDAASALTIDASGNVYVTGLSVGSGTYQDYATIKYYPNGDTAWVRRYNGPVSDNDFANAIAVDGSNNVFVTGASYGSGTLTDYATIKYYPNGDTAWVRRYNGPGNRQDLAYAIAVDGSGNVYVTGQSEGSGTSWDYTTIKYDSSGNELWIKRYNGPNNSWDYAYAMVVDSSGNVYVTGGSRDNGTFFDYATIKYDSSGNQLWAKRYITGGSDIAYAIAVDGSGNLYVTGASWGFSAHFDYATIKYDSSGNVVWVVRYNGPGNGPDEARAIAVDDSGNVCVTGGSSGSGTEDDYATIKYVQFLCGDVNKDGVVDIADVVYLINYLFIAGPAPDPIQAGDVNLDGMVNIADAVYLINYLFIDGPPPCS